MRRIVLLTKVLRGHEEASDSMEPSSGPSSVDTEMSAYATFACDMMTPHGLVNVLRRRWEARDVIGLGGNCFLFQRPGFLFDSVIV